MFLKLTDLNGNRLLVNLKNVKYIKLWDYANTSIHTVDGSSIEVKENAWYITEKLEQYGMMEVKNNG